MKYDEYLMKQFKIQNIDYTVIQSILDKTYIVSPYHSDKHQKELFDVFLKKLKISKFNMIYTTHQKRTMKAKIIFYPAYELDIVRNDISKFELFYILYIIYSKFDLKLFKENIKEIIRSRKK
jgi:hypothetical protein